MKIVGETKVYEKNGDSYAGYRIPSILKAADGSLLGFCEARKNSLSDYGYIDIVVKKSDDNGATWSEQTIALSDGVNTFGNPCCVLDKDSGTIHMVCNFNLHDKGEQLIIEGKAPRKAYYLYSDDNGDTWSDIREITNEVKAQNWGWLAFGPCHGIQTKSGRIVFPGNHTVLGGKRVFYSYAIYSDDGGKTFHCGADIAPNTNECTLAQLSDGRLYINMRSYEGDHRRRRAYSIDEGESWTDYAKDDALIDPVCQGSVAYCEQNGILAFTNAASEKRENLMLRLSKDGGLTWYNSGLIKAGPCAYSDIVWLDSTTLGCLYETGDADPYECIKFAVIKLGE